jgi:hypothetical protein
MHDAVDVRNSHVRLDVALPDALRLRRLDVSPARVRGRWWVPRSAELHRQRVREP